MHLRVFRLPASEIVLLMGMHGSFALYNAENWSLLAIETEMEMS